MSPSILFERVLDSPHSDEVVAFDGVIPHVLGCIRVLVVYSMDTFFFPFSSPRPLLPCPKCLNSNYIKYTILSSASTAFTGYYIVAQMAMPIQRRIPFRAVYASTNAWRKYCPQLVLTVDRRHGNIYIGVIRLFTQRITFSNEHYDC